MLIDAGKLAIQVRIRYLFFVILSDLCRMKKVCSGGHQQPPDTNRNDSGDGQPCVFRGCCQYCCSHPLPIIDVPDRLYTRGGPSDGPYLYQLLYVTSNYLAIYSIFYFPEVTFYSYE